MATGDSRAGSTLQEPADLVVKDWRERLDLAREAFGLGRKAMVPQPRLSLPQAGYVVVDRP